MGEQKARFSVSLAVPWPVLVLSGDAPHFIILAANDAYLGATMTREEQLVGIALFAAFPDNPGDSGATGVGNLRASLHRVLEQRRPDRMALQRYDIRKRGGVVTEFEERHWLPSNTPILEPGCTSVACILHRVDDLTTRVTGGAAFSVERQSTLALASSVDLRALRSSVRAASHHRTMAPNECRGSCPTFARFRPSRTRATSGASKDRYTHETRYPSDVGVHMPGISAT